MKKIITAVLLVSLNFNLAFAAVPTPATTNWGRPVTPEFSPARPRSRIWIGVGLMLLGGFLAIDGFSQVNRDVTDASFVLSGFDIFSLGEVGFGAYWVDRSDLPTPVYHLVSAGNIRNVGNTDIRNMTIHISYRLYGGAQVPWAPGGYFPGGTATVTQNGNVITNLNIADRAVWENTANMPTGSHFPNGPGSNEDGNNAVFNQWAGNVGETFSDRTADGLLQIRITGEYDRVFRRRTKNAFQGYTGVALALTGGYLILDYIVSLRRIERYMQRHHLDFRFAQSNGKIGAVLSKRI
ncbi:MAG: hypothetical protein FWC85_00400 [Elusimicrobia bacterium]|nr:hypothetical protein [Elusimicrobiota bacterium]